MHTVQYLNSLPVFWGWNDSQVIYTLALISEYKTYSKGDIVFLEGDYETDTVFILKSGNFRVTLFFSFSKLILFFKDLQALKGPAIQKA